MLRLDEPQLELQRIYDAQNQRSQIQNVMDQYASLEDQSKSSIALQFIINSYLVAVGFRPLFASDTWSRDEIFWENLIQQAIRLFPQLSFYRQNKHTYVHHPLLMFEYENDKELGALLNFIDLVDLNNKPEDKNSVGFLCSYKNVKNIILTSYIIRGSTQVSKITNKVFQMRLLLKNLNVKVQAQVEPT